MYKCKVAHPPVTQAKDKQQKPVLDEDFLHSAKTLKKPVEKINIPTINLDIDKMKMMKENITTSKICNIFWIISKYKCK